MNVLEILGLSVVSYLIIVWIIGIPYMIYQLNEQATCSHNPVHRQYIRGMCPSWRKVSVKGWILMVIGYPVYILVLQRDMTRWFKKKWLKKRGSDKSNQNQW